MSNTEIPLEVKKQMALVRALIQRDEAFDNYKNSRPMGNTAFQLILQNGKDELRDDVSEFEIDIFLMNS